MSRSHGRRPPHTRALASCVASYAPRDSGALTTPEPSVAAARRNGRDCYPRSDGAHLSDLSGPTHLAVGALTSHACRSSLDGPVPTHSRMAKGKSNPKTVEKVRGMTKAMRNDMELAEAEAAANMAKEKSAKEKKKGRGRRDASSSDDDEDVNAVDNADTSKSKGSNKVQIGGFGIGCRGTGNEKAKRLKEEHDEKTKKKKAMRVKAAEARDNTHTIPDDDDESWRIRNPTVNKKANRKKKGKQGGKERDVSDEEDEVDTLESIATRMENETENENEQGEDTFGALGALGNPGNPDPKNSSSVPAVSVFSLLRGNDDEEEEEEEEEEAKEGNTNKVPSGFAAHLDDGDEDSDASGDDLFDEEDIRLDDTFQASFAGLQMAAETEYEGKVDEILDESETESQSSSESDWETDEELDGYKQPNPLLSLFDNNLSETVDQNLEYMRVTHGFTAPYFNSLTDQTGFVNYLRRKIVRRKQCLYCARRFQTVEGVRGHMRDSNHVKIKFEPPAVFRGNPLFDEALRMANEDGFTPEYSEFYDFGESMDTGLVDNATTALFDQKIGGGLELVLRDKYGHTKHLGHRNYRRYYKQKFRNDYVAKGSRSDEKRIAKNAPAVKLAKREENKKTNAIAVRSMRVALRGSSKALAAQYTTKAQFADNAARRAIVHHWGAGGGGSHYHNSGSKQFLKGVRIKGVVSRHSKQGAKMQAARVQASRNKQNRGNASVAVLRSSTRKG